MKFNPTTITKLRSALGLSMRKFAKKINISPEQLKNIESGINWPSMKIIEAIINTYGVDPDYFFKENNTDTHDY